MNQNARQYWLLLQYPAGKELTLAISCIFAPATSYTSLSFIKRFFCPWRCGGAGTDTAWKRADT